MQPYTQTQLLNACRARINGSCSDILRERMTSVFDDHLKAANGNLPKALKAIRASTSPIVASTCVFLRRVESDAWSWPDYLNSQVGQ